MVKRALPSQQSFPGILIWGSHLTTFYNLFILIFGYNSQRIMILVKELFINTNLLVNYVLTNTL